MTRALLLGFLLAACGPKTFDSVCTLEVPAPAACATTCDPAPGATTHCPSGFHCAAAGTCDASCTPTGGECGAGYACTGDGFCTSTGGPGDPIVDAADCPAVHFTATKTIPSIQLVIDRSGSMLNNFDDQPAQAGDPVKFPTEQVALVGAQGVVTQLEGSVYFGASMFPSDSCPGVFQIGRALNHKAAIQALLDQHNPDPNANTPTPAAIDAVVSDFMANPAPAGSPPVIVLSTDGLPNNCAGHGGAQARLDTIAAAANAFSKGIKLYLLVVGNSIDASFKQQVANAGQGVQRGQPDATAYTATNPTDLAAAFQDIIRGVVSCDLKLSGQVNQTDGRNGTVVLDGASLTYGTDWTLDPDGLTIHLLGNACTTLKSAANPTVDATFACGAIIF